METDGKRFSLFGLGPDGLPSWFSGVLDRPGAGEDIAADIVRLCNDQIGGRGGSRMPSHLVRVWSQMLVEYYGAKPEPLPSFVVMANAHALSLYSRKLNATLPSEVRTRLGLPDLDRPLEYIEAACRDGLALALLLVPLLPSPEAKIHLDDTIELGGVKGWIAAFAKRILSPGTALPALVERINSRKWAIGDGAISRASKRDRRRGLSRAAVDKYRRQAAYQHIASEFAHAVLSALATTNLDPGQPLGVHAAQAAELVDAVELLAMVDMIGVVWNLPDRLRSDD